MLTIYLFLRGISRKEELLILPKLTFISLQNTHNWISKPHPCTEYQTPASHPYLEKKSDFFSGKIQKKKIICKEKKVT